jgi:hypothetical protein
MRGGPVGPEERMLRRVCAALGAMVVAMLLEMVWEVDDRWVATTLVLGVAVSVLAGVWRPRSAQAALAPRPRPDPPAGRGAGSTAPKPDPATTVTISPPPEYFAHPDKPATDAAAEGPVRLVPPPPRPVPDLRHPGQGTQR